MDAQRFGVVLHSQESEPLFVGHLEDCKQLPDSSRGPLILSNQIQGIAEGLAYLHQNGIIHSDIKSVSYTTIFT